MGHYISQTGFSYPFKSVYIFTLSNILLLMKWQVVRDIIEQTYKEGGVSLSHENLDILERYGVNPNRINLEITESAFIEDNEIFIREKDDLKEAGFCFSIDDYGSGFSNYQYVRMVGPTVVKLDRGTLLDAEKGEEQRTLVHNAGCDFIQGFYYSKPLGSEEFLKYIEKE